MEKQEQGMDGETGRRNRWRNRTKDDETKDEETTNEDTTDEMTTDEEATYPR